ncbi:MAG: ABC-2 transporter permease [Bacilli bacterium]|nr:ABC-2 transporter permease [Bacilli bacterium]
MSNELEAKKHTQFISKPLFKQSLKSLLGLWLALMIGSAFIFIVINFAVGSKNVFTNIDMDSVSAYVKEEGLSWLKILGLLEKMGFSLSRIQIMSQIDLNSILNELVYKIAGVLLPMIYVMIAANRLIASQVNDGSMAYILSTPTNRKTVVRTQYVFLLMTVAVMYVAITVSAISSEGIAFVINKNRNPDMIASWNYRTTLLFCLGSFLAMFALSGICFGASAFFNKSNHSIAVGGGACILSFLCCILGLFGNEVFVAVGVGVKPMSLFNYLSLFTLVDNSSMSAFSKALAGYDVAISFDWTWKLAILFVIGVVFSYIGGAKFVKKDLPL